MIKGVLRLWSDVLGSVPQDGEQTHIHDIVEYNESRAFRFRLVPNTNLTNAAVAAKQLVQVFTCDLVVEIFYK